jgi:putative nucleotidyltransferase with HDIG domain
LAELKGIKSTRISSEGLLRVWVGTLVFAAMAICGGLVVSGFRVTHPLATGVLGALAIVAEREAIRLTPTLEVTVASLLCVFAAVVFGPLPAVVVAGVGVLADLPRRDCAQPILRWATWTAARVIAAGTAGVVAVSVRGSDQRGFWDMFAAVAAAFAAESIIDVGLSAVTPAIRRTAPWKETARTVAQVDFASVPFQAPMIAILGYSYLTISPWSVALFAVPAVAAQRLLLLYRQQRESADALGTANARLARANVSFATALVATLDARDKYTAGHSAAVAIYAQDIARELSLPERDAELARVCGLVHDVGKIGLPPGLLEKPGALSPDERRQMEQHSTIGERILRNVDDYGEIAAIVRHHHERLDGLGYPDGLPGEQIPLLSRIIAVADAYNAMTSDRPYRDAMPSGFARHRILQAVGSHFDAVVVDAFEAILSIASNDYRLARGTQFNLGSIGPAAATPAPIRNGRRPARARRHRRSQLLDVR